MLVSKMAALKKNAILRAFGMNIFYWGDGECRRGQCELAMMQRKSLTAGDEKRLNEN